MRGRTIERTLFSKFSEKYKQQKDELEKMSHDEISSSNIISIVEKSLTIATNVSDV